MPLSHQGQFFHGPTNFIFHPPNLSLPAHQLLFEHPDVIALLDDPPTLRFGEPAVAEGVDFLLVGRLVFEVKVEGAVGPAGDADELPLGIVGLVGLGRGPSSESGLASHVSICGAENQVSED